MNLKTLGEQILGFPALSAHQHRMSPPRGTVLVHQDAPLRDVLILTQGLIKLSYLTADGRERIKSFLLNEGILGPRPSVDTPSPYRVTCLSDCRMVRISGPVFETIREQSPELAQQMTRFFDLMAQKKEARERDLLCLSATERYQQMLTESPALCARLTQSDIAAYLGITPVALSRIRGRLRNT